MDICTKTQNWWCVAKDRGYMTSTRRPIILLDLLLYIHKLYIHEVFHYQALKKKFHIYIIKDKPDG